MVTPSQFGQGDRCEHSESVSASASVCVTRDAHHLFTFSPGGWSQQASRANGSMDFGLGCPHLPLHARTSCPTQSTIIADVAINMDSFPAPSPRLLLSTGAFSLQAVHIQPEYGIVIM